MLKKIDQGKLFIEKQAQLFRCPFCHQEMDTVGYSLVCGNNHRFDLSKKGTVFFLRQGHATDYSDAMFIPRGRMIRSGMYQPVIDQIQEWLPYDKAVLDVGCGEGSFLAELQKNEKIATSVGFDISKEGVYLATNHELDSFWCVADLTNLPFADNSFACLLNIFSPSHYQEFDRVLCEEGYLIKVIPQERYLKELREAFYPDEKNKQEYSNKQVVDKLNEKMTVVAQQRVTYQFEIPEENQLDLLSMSPLEWQVPRERKEFLEKNPLKKITIDVDVIKARKK